MQIGQSHLRSPEAGHSRQTPDHVFGSELPALRVDPARSSRRGGRRPALAHGAKVRDKKKIACFSVPACICSRAGNPEMELALNLVWLVLALLSFVWWGAYALCMPRRDRDFSALIALVCVVAFLFPVISMSDDLLSNPALCQTTKVKAGLADAAKADCFVRAIPILTQQSIRANAHPEPYDASPELAWSNLDRRPPPRHSWPSA